MPFVVTESCINCKYSDCVQVCPTDCFHEGPNMLVINPDECIDCGLCVLECPVEAIFDAAEDQMHEWLQINKKYAQTWPKVEYKKEAYPDADEWAKRKDKKQYLIEAESTTI